MGLRIPVVGGVARILRSVHSFISVPVFFPCCDSKASELSGFTPLNVDASPESSSQQHPLKIYVFGQNNVRERDRPPPDCDPEPNRVYFSDTVLFDYISIRLNDT